MLSGAGLEGLWKNSRGSVSEEYTVSKKGRGGGGGGGAGTRVREYAGMYCSCAWDL